MVIPSSQEGDRSTRQEIVSFATPPVGNMIVACVQSLQFESLLLWFLSLLFSCVCTMLTPGLSDGSRSSEEGSPKACARSTVPFSVAGQDTTRDWLACVRVMETCICFFVFPLFVLLGLMAVIRNLPALLIKPWSIRENMVEFLNMSHTNIKCFFSSYRLVLFCSSLLWFWQGSDDKHFSKHASSASDNSWQKNQL